MLPKPRWHSSIFRVSGKSSPTLHVTQQWTKVVLQLDNGWERQGMVQNHSKFLQCFWTVPSTWNGGETEDNGSRIFEKNLSRIEIDHNRTKLQKNIGKESPPNQRIPECRPCLPV